MYTDSQCGITRTRHFLNLPKAWEWQGRIYNYTIAQRHTVNLLLITQMVIVIHKHLTRTPLFNSWDKETSTFLRIIQIWWLWRQSIHSYLDSSGSAAKNPSAMPEVWQEPWVWSLGWEGPLEKEMATHSSILAWKTPRGGEPGRLQSMGPQKSRTQLSD